jgi:hypothetical protein
MNHDGVRVLLISKSENGSSYLQGQLESRGCRCWCARSADDGVRLLEQRSFHLILSTAWLRQGDPLLARAAGSKCAVFFSYPVRDGCWWIPVVEQGRRCLGTSALRPTEFVRVLEQIIRQTQLERRLIGSQSSEDAADLQS